QNRKILARSGTLDSMIDILHYYELSSGKRWTFRDLFSLVSYLLVGDYSEFEVKGKKVSPCDWSAEQYRISKEGKIGSVERDRAPYLLMSRLYFHRLFPRLPGFDSGSHREAKHALFKLINLDSGLVSVKGFFRYSNYAKQLASRISGDVPTRVRNTLGPKLDPGLATGSSALFVRGDLKTTVNNIEDRFSLSISDGLDLVGTQLETLERDVLELLRLGDESLMEEKFPKNRAKQARLLQSTLRQYSARLVKRSLGTRNGVCSNVNAFKHYLKATKEPNILNGVRKGLKNLIHDSNNQFRAGLATTFGQPVAHKSKDVALLLDSSVSVESVDIHERNGRPRDYLPYLLVDDHFVPVTFDLFQALNNVNNGLHDASLPSEIYTLLDRVKSLVAGRVVRDEKLLSEDPLIVLGSSEDVVEYVNGQFIFSREGKSEP
ncbi:MAG: hypothetical protein P8N58_06810, partial [Emcibacteraceae bacterium]|nr:hypothetical protein [Emcibacteraceae bacterium]